MKSIIVTEKEVSELGWAWDPYTYLKVRFLIEHGLNFDESDFFDKTKFNFLSSTDKTAYKVEYIGDDL